MMNQENTQAITTTAETTAAADVNLETLYRVLKYTLKKESNEMTTDQSPYAPTKNVVAVVGNHRVYLSLIETEVRIIFVHKEKISPTMTISVGRGRTYEESLTVFKDTVKGDAKLSIFLDIVKDIISLVTI